MYGGGVMPVRRQGQVLASTLPRAQNGAAKGSTLLGRQLCASSYNFYLWGPLSSFYPSFPFPPFLSVLPYCIRPQKEPLSFIFKEYLLKESKEKLQEESDDERTKLPTKLTLVAKKTVNITLVEKSKAKSDNSW